jgi:hypothetical protein
MSLGVPLYVGLILYTGVVVPLCVVLMLYAGDIETLELCEKLIPKELLGRLGRLGRLEGLDKLDVGLFILVLHILQPSLINFYNGLFIIMNGTKNNYFWKCNCTGF